MAYTMRSITYYQARPHDIQHILVNLVTIPSLPFNPCLATFKSSPCLATILMTSRLCEASLAEHDAKRSTGLAEQRWRQRSGLFPPLGRRCSWPPEVYMLTCNP
jgi:hypothetical protein